VKKTKEMSLGETDKKEEAADDDGDKKGDEGKGKLS
jgi:hypothetical protein